MSNLSVRRDGPVFIVTLERPEVRNAVDRRTATELTETFRSFEHDDGASVAVLTGAGGSFCAGADLKAVAGGTPNEVTVDGNGPLGPTRITLGKPVIAAVEGHAVAGGLELALWCDLRIAGRGAVFGVFCRRWGVPLIDGGTVRLPRIVGHGHAMDMILTGRGVGAEEALQMGLVSRVVETGRALEAAIETAHLIASFPQTCMRADRASAIRQWSLPLDEALREEARGGMDVIASGETLEGAKRFAGGAGRHGSFTEPNPARRS